MPDSHSDDINSTPQTSSERLFESMKKVDERRKRSYKDTQPGNLSCLRVLRMNETEQKVRAMKMIDRVNSRLSRL